MALTLAEAAKLSNDVVLAGVIETAVYESDILSHIPFVELVGNSFTYNRENVAATAAFYDVGDAWSEGVTTFTQVTAALKILGGDADVDNYIQQTRSNVQDIKAAVLALKAKAVARKWDDTFVNGDTASDAKSFDGIKKLVTAGQTITMGANGATLTLAKLDELIDTHKPGKPQRLIMSKRSRRTLNGLIRASGSGYLESVRDNLGRFVELYNGIPISVNDWVSDAEVEGTNADCSSIYALTYGEDGVCGLTNGWIQLENIGSLETKDATRTRVKWYCGLALFNTLKLAKLKGVRA